MHRLASAWNTVLNVAVYPSTWLHEQTHYLVLRPYVTTASHDYAPARDGGSLRVETTDCPRWRSVLGALAPTVVGLACAVLAACLVALGVVAATADLVNTLVVAAYWFMYTVPSRADLVAAVGAAGGREAVQRRGGGA